MSTYPVHPRARGRRAFTLIELLTVVAIIGVLAAILIPTVGAVRQSARATACASNLREIGGAVHLFVADNQGLMPGKGKRTPTASASWQDVLNARVFGADVNAAKATLQRMGDTPQPGQMYCPGMEPFGTSVRYPRAYVLNTYVIDSNTTTNPPVTWGDLLEYQKGLPLRRFATPARTLLVFESERESDVAQPTAPLDQIVMGDGASQPSWSANSGNFAFRHKNRMNALFVDGHVQSLGTAEFAKLNNNAGFNPAGL